MCARACAPTTHSACETLLVSHEKCKLKPQTVKQLWGTRQPRWTIDVCERTSFTQTKATDDGAIYCFRLRHLHSCLKRDLLHLRRTFSATDAWLYLAATFGCPGLISFSHCCELGAGRKLLFCFLRAIYIMFHSRAACWDATCHISGVTLSPGRQESITNITFSSPIKPVDNVSFHLTEFGNCISECWELLWFRF